MTVRRTPSTTTLADLQRHLAWCRRRDEQAAVLVMHVPASAAQDNDSLRAALRFTDSVHVEPEADGYVVTAVLGDAEVSHAGLEQRVRERLETADIRFGWAAFPADGLTLEDLRRLADPGAPRVTRTTVPSSSPTAATAGAIR